MFTILNTMETRYKIFRFIQKCLSRPATVTRKTKEVEEAGFMWDACSHFYETFNVINLFHSYEQRSCPSTFVVLWGLTAGPLPQQTPNDSMVFLRTIFCVASTCSISLPFPRVSFPILRYTKSYIVYLWYSSYFFMPFVYKIFLLCITFRWRIKY